MAVPLPSVNATLNDWLEPVIAPIVGAPAVSIGVETAVVSDALPIPTALTARIWTEYAVPFVSPVITSGDATTAGLGVTQLLPLLVEY